MSGTQQRILIAFALLACPSFFNAPLHGQNNAQELLAQVGHAVSGGSPITKVSISGTATMHAGSTIDTGSAMLYADASGKVTMQLELNKLGARTEQLSAGPLSPCTWSGADGVSHAGNGLNCWRPVAWFFPALSLQPASLLQGTGVSDMGSGVVGGGTYRHLQSQLTLPTLKPALAAQLAKESAIDLGLDPGTLLPAVMTYSTRPDSGPPTFVAVAIHYSNYQKVSGVQVPFHIERYINGSLQLSIDVSSAQIN